MELLSLMPSPASELLRKLSAAGILAPVSGMDKGIYAYLRKAYGRSNALTVLFFAAP